MVFMRDKANGVGRMSGDTGAHPECEVKTLNDIAVQVRSSEMGRDVIGRSAWKGHNSGRHDKTPIRCPCSQLAALRGAAWTYFLWSHPRGAGIISGCVISVNDIKLSIH